MRVNKGHSFIQACSTERLLIPLQASETTRILHRFNKELWKSVCSEWKHSLNLHLRLASVAWFSLWSAGSPFPLRPAGPQWPAVGESRRCQSLGCTWVPQPLALSAAASRPAAGHIGPWKVRRCLIAKKMAKVFSTLIWGIKVCLSALSVNRERNPGIKLCPLNPLQQPCRCRVHSLSSRTGRPLCSGLNPWTDACYTNTRG